jgi:hypothetical protein
MGNKTEKRVQAEILNELGSRSDVRLFRNNVGVSLDASRPMRFGLCAGSSDLIGFRRLKITPDMVGNDIAQFLAIECKSSNGKPTKEQQSFIDIVNRFGGKAFIARSADEALSLLS